MTITMTTIMIVIMIITMTRTITCESITMTRYILIVEIIISLCDWIWVILYEAIMSILVCVLVVVGEW